MGVLNKRCYQTSVVRKVGFSIGAEINGVSISDSLYGCRTNNSCVVIAGFSSRKFYLGWKMGMAPTRAAYHVPSLSVSPSILNLGWATLLEFELIR